MYLNTIKPAAGSNKAPKRVGRGIGSGWGKTSARGHKGQKARSGGYHKVGFEGGQMPLQRRLPKRGFRSALQLTTAEIRTHELAKVSEDIIDLAALRNAGLIHSRILRAKVMLSGSIEKAVTLKGIAVSKGAKEAIEKVGGKVE
ncbi:50S ribosomal protein L15 [bacterium BMS3Bbin11]|nr:50S ribosomal protein L15 [bacterium BMS3Abin11]GBE45822.1 50S ribosomal protein L15 [bacterium BMS3Bbin11]GMT39305.1 MAG: 50S ribosomal protein L15 [bacterium]HDH08392.1 50S ribosomal protein L15 [Gammaproteobacteria bacterium]HDH15942.1 50S ribosomal protein L15 [Gammaproteobacteria bacterium]